MLCYKDKSFCSAKCAETHCHRQFTDKERENADKWWATWGSTHPVPVAFSDFSPTCPAYIPIIGEDEQ